MSAYLSGLFLGLSLILAIGAQNAFVLKQGLKKNHVLITCLICSISDALLITLGVLGFGLIISEAPFVEPVARYGGALFLTIYGVRSLISSWKTKHALSPEESNRVSLKTSILTCLAFTWLNPHVYLDTVVLMGSISSQFDDSKFFFTLGAVSASFIFFFILGYGARFLIPFFKKTISWKILEFLIGVVMLTIAGSLLITS